LRHTAATLMLAEGWDVKVVAQLLGHTTVTTTSKYLDELPGELSVAVNAHPLTPTQVNNLTPSGSFPVDRIPRTAR
jgi:integrase/recombinase XerC